MSLWNESLWYSLWTGVALKGTAVLGVAWLTAILFRRQSAAARHLVWTAATAALLVLPFLSMSLPALRLPIARAFAPAAAVFYSAATVPVRSPDSQTLPGLPVTVRVGSGSWRPDLILTLTMLWTAGAAAMFTQMALAWAALWRIRRKARRFAAPEFPGLSKVLGIRHSVDLLESPRGSMPMTFGLLCPAVFLPADAAEWSTERRRVVLLHELAHVRRADVATQLLARTALSLHWWNPLAWLAWREFLKERERAADDLVLSAGARATEYAEHLLAIARSLQLPTLIGPAAIAMAPRSHLEGRLQSILDSRVNRSSPGRALTVAATLLATAIVIPIAALRAQDTSVRTIQTGADEASVGRLVPVDVETAVRTAIAQGDYKMLDEAARAAISLRKYDVAKVLLEGSLKIRADVAGQQSADYGVGLLQLGDLERRRGKAGRPESFYTEAAAVLGERSEAATALTYLGIYAMGQNNLDQALAYFEHAKLVNPKNAGPPVTWMAVLRQRQNNMAQAETLYIAALSIEDPASPQAATTMELYADFLIHQNREDEAKSMQERAITLRKALGVQARPASSSVYKVGTGGVTSPKLLSKVEPEYTDEARAAKYQGTAMLSVEVGPDGIAHNIRMIRGLGLGLDDKAMEAVSQWRFQPGMKDGQPVVVAANIEINWRLM